MTWFKNLNTMPKLMLSFGIILAFTAGIGFMGTYMLNQQGAYNDLLFKRDVGGLMAIRDFEVTKSRMSTTLRNTVIAAAAKDSKEQVDGQEKQFDSQIAQLHSQWKAIDAIVYRPNLRSVMDQLKLMLPEYEQRSRPIFQHAKLGDAAGAAKILAANNEFVERFNALVTSACQIKLANLQASREIQAQQQKATISIILWLMGATLLLGFGLSYYVSRGFSRPLTAAAHALEELSAGDLTHRLQVTSKDEIGKMAGNLNLAFDSLERLLSDVDSSAKNLSVSSHQLARAADALASGAQEQAASLEQTSASLEEITATVRQNSDNAKHASQLAISSRDSAEKGGQATLETVSAMKEIQSSSAKIAEIITTMDEIAFQTNLLSVNASVEAARAGVHGKGFKVVAAEVRNLAQRSAAAAKEIKSLIHGSVKKVENGSKLAENSGSTLAEIISSAKRVSDIVGEIAAASQEQATGIEQVGKAMVQMDQVTQSNASQTEQLSATAASLSTQSAHLASLISRFVFTQSQNESSPQAEPAPPVAILPREDATQNLERMARNVGRSIVSKIEDREFEEF